MDPRAASPGLTELGRRIGASKRTLSRLYRDEVGMTYTVWRNQLRLHLVTLVLAEGRVSPMQIEATNRREDRLINAVRDRAVFVIVSCRPRALRTPGPARLGWKIDQFPVHATVALDRWWTPPGRDLISPGPNSRPRSGRPKGCEPCGLAVVQE